MKTKKEPENATPARSKRIQFTKTELDVIINMACIADAFGCSDGDYQEWTEADWESIASIMRKANDLLHRKE